MVWFCGDGTWGGENEYVGMSGGNQSRRGPRKWKGMEFLKERKPKKKR